MQSMHLLDRVSLMVFVIYPFVESANWIKKTHIMCVILYLYL